MDSAWDNPNRTSTCVQVAAQLAIVAAAAIVVASARCRSYSLLDGAVQRVTADQRNRERAQCHQHC